jgi:ubiquinone/menaquinone biosynthesis C-methylase UbiE
MNLETANIKTSMVSYYADRAKEYERIYQKPERQDDLRQLRGFVESSFAGRTVFELACGTGYWTDIISRSASSVVATDINEEVLTIARSKRIDATKTRFQTADAYALPDSLGQFTGGLSVFWWSHIPKLKLRGFLQNFHRVFSPDARVVFIDNVFVEGNSTPVSRTDENGDSYQLRRLDDGSTHEVLKNFPTESELRNVVCDFATDTQVEFLRYYWRLSYTPKTFI